MTVEDFIVHLKSFDPSEQTADWFAEQQSYAQSLGLSWTEICALMPSSTAEYKCFACGETILGVVVFLSESDLLPEELPMHAKCANHPWPLYVTRTICTL